jgi:hypothetical protein
MTGTKMSVDEILGRKGPEPELTDEQKFAELMKRLGREWDPGEVPN